MGYAGFGETTASPGPTVAKSRCARASSSPPAGMSPSNARYARRADHACTRRTRPLAPGKIGLTGKIRPHKCIIGCGGFPTKSHRLTRSALVFVAAFFGAFLPHSWAQSSANQPTAERQPMVGFLPLAVNAPATSQQDNTPPVLTALSFAPGVDTTTGPATLTV